MPFALNRYWQLLSTYLAPYRGRLALLATLIVAATGLQLIGPQLIGRFIDAATAGSAQPALLGLAATYIVAAVAQRVANFGALYVGETLGWAATNSLRADLARHVIGLDLGFHKTHTPGELIERLDGDVTALANFFSQLSVFVAANGLLISGILVALWLQDWRVGLGLTLYTLVSLVALSLVQRLGQRRWEQVRAADSRTVGFLEERLQGTEDIRAAGAEAHTLRQFDQLLGIRMAAFRAARMAANLAYAATNFLSTLGYAAGLALGAALFLTGSASIGQAYLIVAYVGMLASPLDKLREQAQDLQKAGASIDRVAALFAAQPLVREHASATLPEGALAVEFDSVTFGYADDPPTTDAPLGHEGAKGREPPRNRQRAVRGPEVRAVRAPSRRSRSRGARPSRSRPSTVHRPPSSVLQHVSLSLRPGEILGLLGRTGSGKSTLSRLLLRLYDPQGGAIRLGGADLRVLALGDLRRRVGMVTQEVQLFQASVRENLTMFDPLIDDARVEVALRALGLWEWAHGLPQGLDTALGGGGQGLSAGEAQLLAFTRVFLKDPGLVILDEASSRLDPATERLLERAISRLLAGRSAIIIAHRLATVERADSIAILEGGRLAELGPRAALAANPRSHFARLLRTGIEEVLA